MIIEDTGMADDTEISVIDVDQRHGAVWAKLRNNALIERSWIDRFCALIPVGGEIVDIGCGSGLPIAAELIERGFSVTGVDGTPAMIALFRHNLPGVAAHLADMRELALNRRFQGLLAWDSFFHLRPDDQRRMFPRFQAHAEPGAALMFSSGPAEGEAIGDLEGDRLYHGSLDPDEYRHLLNVAGFSVIAHIVEDPDCGHRTSWLAQQRG